MGETKDAVDRVYDQLTLRRPMLYDNIYITSIYLDPYLSF